MLPGVAWRTPKPISRALRLLVPIILRRELDPAMNATRTALGLRAERDSMLRLLTSDHGHIALWDEALRPQAPGDPPGLVTCGFPFLEDAAALPAEVAEFLETDPPPIVCALGTTGGPMPLPVADLVAELASSREGARCSSAIDRRPPLGRRAGSRSRLTHAFSRRRRSSSTTRGWGLWRRFCVQASRVSCCRLQTINSTTACGSRDAASRRYSTFAERPRRCSGASCASFSTIVLPRVRRLAWAHACELRTARGVPPTP